MNLTKKMKDLYIESYKTLLKELKDLNKWKGIPRSWGVKLTIVRVVIIPKAIYTFNTISSKTLTSLFAELEKPILNFI